MNHTPEISIFVTWSWYFFSNDPLFPKMFLLKYWLKKWGLSRSQYYKTFWWVSCIGKFYFELCIWNKCMFKRYFIVFSNYRLFPKIMKILLFKYWLKSWELWRSQLWKRFWLAYCIRKIFILNRTPDISLFLTWIWYFFWMIQVSPKHEETPTQILGKYLGPIIVSIL